MGAMATVGGKTGSATVSLPLFPLHCVLIPGARLSLRIFEPRYLDLVRDCGRKDSGFGVCAILEGSETGKPAVPVALGTEARIVDFTTLSDGLLGITVQGGRRLHVERTRIRDNGLIVADVTWLEEPPTTPLEVEHELLATLLQRLIEQLDATHASPAKSAFADAGWVSWRLAELLPMALDERQALLQESDPAQRMCVLRDLIARMQPD